MIGVLLIAVAMNGTAASVQSQDSDVVFACQHFQNERDAGDGWVHVVDMRAVKHRNATWTLERGKHLAVTATPFDVKRGSLETFLALRWKENGRKRTAYLSFPNVALPDGIQAFRLNFDRPPPWKAPGYICQSEGEKAAGAGA